MDGNYLLVKQYKGYDPETSKAALSRQSGSAAEFIKQESSFNIELRDCTVKGLNKESHK